MRSLLGQRCERLFVGDRAPQEGGDGILLDLLQARRHAGLAEIFLRQHVGGDLRPEFRHFDIVGRNTTEPSGFLISLVVSRNSMSA